MEQQLQRLLDIETIKNAHARYCRGIDRMDWELSVRVITRKPSTTTARSRAVWTNSSTGLPTCCRANSPPRLTSPASKSWNWTVKSADGSVHDWILNLCYIDQIERRNGEWRFVRRLIVSDSEIRCQSAPAPLT
jgi:hypothetical protein